MNIREKGIAIDVLVTLEQHHIMRAQEIRSVITEIQSKQGGIASSHYEKDMSLPQKILYVIGEAGVYSNLQSIAESIVNKEGIDDLTSLKAQVSKRLHKLKKEGKINSKRMGASLHSTRYGLVEWG